MPMKCCICADTKAKIVRLINHSFAALCKAHRQAHAAVITEEQPDPAVCTKCGAACVDCGMPPLVVEPRAPNPCAVAGSPVCENDDCIWCHPLF